MAKKAYIGVEGKARKIKKGYIGVENFVPRALPEGYTQVEYLESSGTQYIDTGFTPNQDTKLTMKVVATTTENAATSGGFVPYGSSDSSTGNAYECYTWNGNQEANYDGQRSTLSAAIKDKKLVITQDKNVFTLVSSDGTTMTNAFTYNEFTAPRSLLLFATHRSTPLKGKQKIYSCQIYDNGVLIRDYVPCTNSGGTAGMYDMVNSVFYQNAGSGTFLIGSSTYESVARKIKKAYIGIGGVARPCWSGGELAYYGSITALSVARSELAATTIGNYALFGGGQNYGSYYSTVDAYNASLVRSTPTALSVAKYTLGATSVGNYALFAGGQTKSSSISATVDTYNKSLTKSTATDLRIGRNNISATTIGNYALFAGGSSTGGYAYVDAYDGSLTKTSPTNLSESKTQLAATTIGDYALFAGGTTEPDAGYAKNSVDTYNKSLTKGTATKMQESKYLLAATTVGGYAIFFGGTTGYTYSGTTVDAYNASLTRTAAPTARKYNRKSLSATTVEGFAIFAGGLDQDEVMNVVEVYDGSLTKTMTTTLSAGRFRLSATTIGNYALFGGGKPSRKSANSDVEAFTVA